MKKLISAVLVVVVLGLAAVPATGFADPGPDPCEKDPRYCR